MPSKKLLIPSLLDDHFPLLRHAFASRYWQPVLLTEDRGLADLGLRYVHSEMCYPAILVAGQILAALGSGRYDPAAVYVTTDGDQYAQWQQLYAGDPNVTLFVTDSCYFLVPQPAA